MLPVKTELLRLCSSFACIVNCESTVVVDSARLVRNEKTDDLRALWDQHS